MLVTNVFWTLWCKLVAQHLKHTSICDTIGSHVPLTICGKYRRDIILIELALRTNPLVKCENVIKNNELTVKNIAMLTHSHIR